MRILLVNHQFSMSGAAMMLLQLADVLRAAGHELRLAVVDPADGPMATLFAERGLEAIEQAGPQDVDLVIANTLSSAPLVARLAPVVPTIWWIHESGFGIDLLLRHPEWVEAFHLAHRIVMPNAWVRDHVYRSFLFRRRAAHVVVIPNGIHVERPAVPEPKTRPFRIVCVGSVHGHKRQHDLVAAVARLDRNDVELAMIGKVVNLERSASALVEAAPDRYRLLGELNPAETRRWIASADLMALPSQSESQTLSLGEAAFLSVPVVMSDLPMLADLGWHHGETCLMQPVGNVAMLAHNIAYLLDNADERARLGRAVRRMVRGYRLDAFAHRFVELIAEFEPVS